MALKSLYCILIIYKVRLFAESIGHSGPSESDTGGLHVLECGQEDCKQDPTGGCSNDSPLPGKVFHL